MPSNKRRGPSPEQMKRIDNAFDAVAQLVKGIPGFESEGGQMMTEPGRYLCMNADVVEHLIALARLGADQPRPGRMTALELASTLREMAALVDGLDSYGGWITYDATVERAVYAVTGAYRTGNAMGQGGMVLIGESGA